jgi:hypothetical protein
MKEGSSGGTEGSSIDFVTELEVDDAVSLSLPSSLTLSLLSSTKDT